MGQELSRHRFLASWLLSGGPDTTSKEQQPRNQIFVSLFFIFLREMSSLFAPIVLIPVRPNRGLRRLRPRRRRRPGGRRPFYKIGKLDTFPSTSTLGNTRSFRTYQALHDFL